jgi:hypothetical protein
MDEVNILLKRNSIVQKLDYYIEESIYYRTHSEQFANHKIKVINLKEDSR